MERLWESNTNPVFIFQPHQVPAFAILFTGNIGRAFLFLANAEKLKGKIVDFFCVFGRVPFFFYIIHIYLIHFLALITAAFTSFDWQKMNLPALPFRVEALKGFGFNLFIVYLAWMLVIALLYPLCKKFDRYQQARKEKWWLSYL